MTKIDYKYGFPLFSRTLNIITIGSSKTIISDVWDYLIKKHKAFSLLQQAKNFYEVVEKSEFKTAFVLLLFFEFFKDIENSFPVTQNYNHGIGEKNNQSEIKI